MKNIQTIRSNYKKRMISLLWAFGVSSLIIIPVFTLYLGIHGNPLTTPLSAIGNRSGMRAYFLTWTVIICAFYSSMIFALIVLTKNTRAKILRILIFISTWILVAANLIPFLPDRFPFLATLHRDGTRISVVILAFTLLLFTFTFRNYYPKLFKKTLIFLLCLLFVLLQLYIFFEASWITEAIGVVGSGIFLFTVLFWLYKENNFDAEDVLQTYDLNVAEKEVLRLENRTKQAYDEYIKLNETSRIALVEYQELKKRYKN